MQKHRTAHLLPPVERQGGATYFAKWREADGTQVKRRIGFAWVERGEATDVRRRTRHDGWRKRRGRAKEGWLTEDAALAAIPGVIENYRREQASKAEAAALRAEHRVSFDQVASEWLAHRVSVGGIKNTTLNDYRSMLRYADEQPKPRGRKPVARVMTRFGGRPAASITRLDVTRWLKELDGDPALSARSVNKHRGVVHAIFEYGRRPDTFGLAENPVVGSEKRREADMAEILTYTPEEVLAIAQAAREGAHRDPRRPAVTGAEIDARRLEDEQDAVLFLVAAFCGLRQGELLALRWRNVGWDAERVHVQRSYTLGQEDSTKGRRARTVPMAEQPLRALAKLGERSMFTKAGDLVFCSRTGGHLDASSLRLRYKAARDATIAANPDMQPLRFHDLRHSFGTMAAQRFDLVNVGNMLGHRDTRTTARYLHARPASEDAAKLSGIFGRGSGITPLPAEPAVADR